MHQIDKNLSNDRILVLQRMEGKNGISETGLVDNRLFDGGNRLHAFMETNGLWAMKYDHGILPEFLKQQFTSFSKLRGAVTEYFKKRNIEIKETIDASATS